MCVPSVRLSRRFLVLGIIPCLFMLIAGCGGSGKKVYKMGSVKGKVTFNGHTLPAGCKITFTHKEEAFPATADIGSDGSYTLLFNGKPEIPVGTYDVAIIPPQDMSGPPPDPSNPEAYKAVMTGGEGPSRMPMNKEVFPRKYQDPAKSMLTCTVMEGQDVEYNVDMTSGK